VRIDLKANNSGGSASDFARLTVTGASVFLSVGSTIDPNVDLNTRLHVSGSQAATLDIRPTLRAAGGSYTRNSSYRVDLFAPGATITSENVDLDVRSHFPDAATGWLTVAAENGDAEVTELMGDLRVRSIRGDDVVIASNTGSILGDGGQQAAHVTADNLRFHAAQEVTMTGQRTLKLELPGDGIVEGVAGTDARLEELTGDMQIEWLLTGDLGSITLVAPGALLWADVPAAERGFPYISTGTLTLTGSGIGSAAQPLPMNVSQLTANGRQAGVWIRNTGGLLVDTIEGGSVQLELVADPASTEPLGLFVLTEIRADDDVTISLADKVGTEDILTFGHGSSVTAAAGAISLTAGDRVSLDGAAATAGEELSIVTRSATIDGNVDTARIEIRRSTGAGDVAPDDEGFIIRNLNLRGPLSFDGNDYFGVSPDGTSLVGATVDIRNVHVADSTVAGIRVDSVLSVYLLDSTVRDSQGDGIDLDVILLGIVGNVTSESNQGAGLSVQDSQLILVGQSTFNDNRNRGIYVKDVGSESPDTVAGTFAVWNSTISGNSTNEDRGGGILVDIQPHVSHAQIHNSTITQNRVDKDGNQAGSARGGGVAVVQGTVDLKSSIVADNFRTATVKDDVFGLFSTDSIRNLIGVGANGIGLPAANNQLGTPTSPLDPRLEPLAFNGGDTRTHALMRDSLAIDQGKNSLRASIDQRGLVRAIETPSTPNASDGTDVGAFEFIEADFGDAPDSYATSFLDNGPFHLPVDGPYLGTFRDIELDGQASAAADGDDLDGDPDDEDGIIFLGVPRAGQLTAIVSVTLNGAEDAMLDAWIDFDHDGSWRSAGEQIATSTQLVAGENRIQFAVPTWAVAGDTIARFRVSSQGGLSPFGSATMRLGDDTPTAGTAAAGTDGEVEDVRLTIAPATSGGVFAAAEDVGTLPDADAFISDMILVDLNRDGDLDVVVSTDTEIYRYSYFFGTYLNARRLASIGTFGEGSTEVVDIDRDGDNDIVAAASSPYPRVVLLENDGNDNFTPRTIRTLLTSTQTVRTVDMDADGDLDVVASINTLADSTDIVWYENDDSIEPHLWTERFLLRDAGQVYQMSIADMNGDAVPDVLVARTKFDLYNLIWLDGANGFQAHTAFTDLDSNAASNFGVGDLDGDGDNDIVLKSPFLEWLENPGPSAQDNSFTRHAIDPQYGRGTPTLVDMDGDGDLDIVTRVGDEDFTIFLNESGQWRARQIDDPDATGIFRTAVGDVDDDGDLEIFAAYVGGEPDDPGPNHLRFHRQAAVDVGDADAALLNRAAHVAVGSQLGPLRDEDPLDQPTGTGNQDDDLGSANDEDGVVLDSPIRAGQQDASVTVNVVTTSVAVLDAWIDFDRDGFFGGPHERIAAALELGSGDHKIEFVVPANTASGDHMARFRLTDRPAAPESPTAAPPVGVLASGEVEDHLIRILPAKPQGVWTHQAIDLGGKTVTHFALADLNGGGRPDLITAATGITWQFGLGNGSWAVPQVVAPAVAGTEFSMLTTVDLDLDGDLDILAAQSAPFDRLSWFENNSGSYTRHDIATQQSDIRSVVAADFDRDGDWDLLVASLGDSVVQLYENDGAQAFLPVDLFGVVVPAVMHIAVGDVDGDGDLDAAVASPVGGLYWLENRGDAQPRLVEVEGGNFSRVALADLDNDGDLDIVAISPSGASRGTYWFENRGGSNPKFDIRSVEDDATTPSDILPADVNADGHLDLIRISVTSDSQTVYLSDGANRPVFAPQDISVGPAGARAATSGTLSDYDYDGDLDLVTLDILGNLHAYKTTDPGDAPVSVAGPPTADVAYVDDPRGPGSVFFMFSETVSGFGVGDLQLRRGSNTVSLSGAALERLSTNEYQLYLPAAARYDGDYELVLTAAGSGIVDPSGTPMTASASTSWTRVTFSVGLAEPVATQVSALPDVTIEFTAPPNFVDVNDFRLTANGLPQSLSSLTLVSESATRYTLPLSSLDAPLDGQYELVFERAGSNIFTVDAHPLTNSLTVDWMLDTAAPRARMLHDVSSRPHSEPFYGAFVRFSENMFSGLYHTNLRLERNGEPVDISGIRVEQENFRDFEIELRPFIQLSGDYVFTIGPASDPEADFVRDRAGNRIEIPLVVPFTIDLDAPTATIQPPAPGGPQTLTIVFAEPVENVDVRDLRLSRDGHQIELDSDALAKVDGTDATYTLSLPTAASVSGRYTLSVFPSIADIEDAAGNRMSATAAESWTVDRSAPTVDILDVTPDMRQISVGLVTFEFSEPVTGFDVGDVIVRRDGDPIFAPHLQLVPLSTTRYGVDLSRITTISGTYRVTLDHATAGIRDASGNLLAAGDVEDFSILFVDVDADSIGDVIESRAPNAGDGNRDDTPDAEQAHVASLPAPQDGTYVTVVADPNQTLADVQIVEQPVGDGAPDDIDFRLGFLDYDLTGVPVGGSTVVTIYLEDATSINNYYQFAATTI